MSNTENNPIAETTGYWECLWKAYEGELITKNELRIKLNLPAKEGFDFTKSEEHFVR